MTVRRAAAITALALALLTPATHADAATHRWNHTRIDYGRLKVGWCSGGTKTLTDGTRTDKDVCRFWWPHNTEMYVYVGETGTVLFDRANCGDGRWQSFTSRTDTSRTARVTVTTAWCA